MNWISAKSGFDHILTFCFMIKLQWEVVILKTEYNYKRDKEIAGT